MSRPYARVLPLKEETFVADSGAMWATASATNSSPRAPAAAAAAGSRGDSEEQRTHLGMTAPISLSQPTEADVLRTEALVEAMRPHGVFESEEELNHRWVGRAKNLIRSR